MRFQYLCVYFHEIDGKDGYVKVLSAAQEDVETIINLAKELETRYCKVVLNRSPLPKHESSPKIYPGRATLRFWAQFQEDRYYNHEESYGEYAYRAELIGKVCELGWEPFAVEHIKPTDDDEVIYHFRRACEG